jgi:predicted oxidoreductase
MSVENKITTFDHADIYGSYTPKPISESIFFKQRSERKYS